jgi:hypothetical protein
MKPAKHQFSVLKQLCDHIPPYLVTKLANEHGVSAKSRSYSPWSHIVSLIYAQLSHALSLNDICDSQRNHSCALDSIRGATAPSRNGLSHANKIRNPQMAEDLFWQVLKQLMSDHPKFVHDRKYSKLPRKFKRTINAIDSSTIQLIAKCLGWAKHRRRKAAAKMHMRLDLQSFLPRFAIIKNAGTHDSTEAYELCADIKAGEIVVADKAYVDFKHLYKLDERGVFWVTRSKDNMLYEAVGQHTAPKRNIIRDEVIKLTGDKTSKNYSQDLRLVEAKVEVNGKEKVMTFITNNFEWSATSICDLYKARWGIEVFFKEIKQSLQLTDFLGNNENAVLWQVWVSLLTYILVRFVKFSSGWTKSFARLFTLIRGTLWDRLDLESIIKCCGTAPGKNKIRGAPEKAFQPIFDF